MIALVLTRDMSIGIVIGVVLVMATTALASLLCRVIFGGGR